MSNVGLPPDIVAQQAAQQGQRGIGGGAMENVSTAQKRGVAMNTLEPKAEAAEPAAKAASVEPEEASNCTNQSCNLEVKKEWNFCPVCNTDLLRGGPTKKLGVQFSEEDLSDYLFKGYIVKEITMLGKHKATMKSSQPKDLEHIDAYIMNGPWGKNDDGSDRKVSDFYMRQVNAMCMTASVVVKIDGESIGNSIEARMEWLKERGSSFVDILSGRVALFNQALVEYLKKEDTILGS